MSGRRRSPVIPEFGEGSDCVRENRSFCWDWVQRPLGPTRSGRALVEHIELTLIAVAIGFVIAFVAALVALPPALRSRAVRRSSRRSSTPSRASRSSSCSCRSPGLTVTTVEVALVGYTLLILFRNILAGLRGVPPECSRRRAGWASTPTQTLLRVELPLALPAIVAGVRIAAVTTISLATIAAFVLPEGLGAPIFDGLRTFFTTKFIAAGALAVGARACRATALLVLAQRALTPWARRGGRSVPVLRPRSSVFVDALRLRRRQPALRRRRRPSSTSSSPALRSASRC